MGECLLERTSLRLARLAGQPWAAWSALDGVALLLEPRAHGPAVVALQLDVAFLHRAAGAEVLLQVLRDGPHVHGRVEALDDGHVLAVPARVEPHDEAAGFDAEDLVQAQLLLDVADHPPAGTRLGT